MVTGVDRHEERQEDWRADARRLEGQVNDVILGQTRAVRLLVIAMLARGHVLLEGDVGVGKTTLLRALARGIGGAYERIEGTVDLMPTDFVYHTYVTPDGQPRVDPGPLLKHGEALAVFFFNEINRARPQVHSLMLRVMAERSVNAFNREHRLPHLQVYADRNRVEKEETFEIPAAARDRFLFEVTIEMPEEASLQRALLSDPRFHDVDALVAEVDPGAVAYDALNDVAARIQGVVSASEALERYALDLCLATRRPAAYGVRIDGDDAGEVVQAGASPRGMSMLMRAAKTAAWLAGRTHVLPEDVHAVYAPAIAHRVFFHPVYELRRSQLAAALAAEILDRVASP